MNAEIPLGSACSGYGGLELGIGLVIPNLVTRWVADYEPPKKGKPQKQSAAKVLAHRYPDAPNLGDITIVNWSSTTPVRVICAGTPCQDVSAAGARAGMRAGTRSGIWSSMVSAIEHHRPTLVIWENVRGALSAEADSNVEPCPICMGDERECTLRALGRVLGDLAELGYDTVWYGLPASAVGAPHERFRVFVAAWPANAPGIKGSGSNRKRQSADRADQGGRDVADPTDLGHERSGPARRRGDGPPDRRHPSTDSDSIGREPVLDGVRPGQPDATGGSGNAAANTRHRDDTERSRPEGRETGQRSPIRPEPRRDRPGPDIDTSGTGEHAGVDWGQFKSAIHRWERVLGRYAPTPTGVTTRGGQALSPAFVEWMMGLPGGWVTNVPDLTRNEQLHVLGNGVVPQQAGAAVEYLLGFAPAWVRADLGLSTPSPKPVDNPGHGHVTP